MTKKKILNVFMFLFVAVVALCAAMGVSLQKNSAKADLSAEGLQEEYFVGESLEIPNGEFKISDTVTIKASHIVIYPNGVQTSESKVNLSEYGRYTVRYQAEFNGENYVKDVSFNAVKPLFELNGDGSVEYTTHEVLGEEAVKVALFENTTLRYNQKINLSALKKTDSLLTFFVTPERAGYAEFQILNFKLVDANDASRYVILQTGYELSATNDKRTNTYSFAHINEETTLYMGSTAVEIKKGYTLGIKSTMSFYECSDDFISYSFDSANNAVWISDSAGAEQLLLDFKAFPELLDGFGKDGVYLEVFAENYRATTANFVIGNICDIAANFTALYDDTPPVIDVDLEGYSVDSLPFGCVNSAYPLFSATALDNLDAMVDVKVAVYENYYSDNKISVSVANGAFVPKRAGKYTVVYSARDKFGNEGVKELDVDVLDAVAPIEISLEGATESAMQGSTVRVAQALVSGGEGKLNTDISVAFSGEVVELSDDNTFVPMRFGEYTVTYTVRDYIGQVETRSYTVEVEYSEKPVFLQNPNDMVDRYLIVGNTYALPNVSAAVFNADNTYEYVQPSISSESVELSGKSFTVTEKGDISITYFVEGNGYKTEETVERTAYSIRHENNLLNLKDIFLVSSDVTSYYNEAGYATYGMTQDSSIYFANKLLASNVSLEFNFVKGKNYVKQIDFKLVNTVDAAQAVVFSIINIDNVAFLSINGIGAYSIGMDFSGAVATALSYNDYKHTITVNGYSFDVSDCFNGFSNQYVYLEINFIDVDERGLDFVVQMIGNQSLKSSIGIDMGGPIISYLGEYGGNYAFGSKFYVTEFLALDIIGGADVKCFMSILLPNGEYAKLNNTEINSVSAQCLTLDLDLYGKYVFTFVAEDALKKKTTVTFAVNVLDDVSPEASLAKGYTTKGKVGEKIQLAKVNASDNIDESDKLTIVSCVKDGQGNLKLIDGSFNAKSAGTYTIYYYISDSFGNYTILNYIVTVE